MSAPTGKLKFAYDSIANLEQQIATLRAQLAASEELVERLRMEAQTHAQEARTQRATVHECYQIATGGKGEPGDWHGAEPVRQTAERLAVAEARAERLESALQDVAMSLKTCAWALRRGTAPGLGERSLELLKRHGLLGSPLRGDADDGAALAEGDAG